MGYLPGEVLTDRERAACFRAGFVQKLAEEGVRLSDAEGMAKRAALNIPGLGELFRTSIVLGLPIGGVLHVVGKSSRGNDVGNRKLRGELEYYRDVTQALRDRLGPKEEEPPAKKKDDDEEKKPATEADKPKFMSFGEDAY